MASLVITFALSLFAGAAVYLVFRHGLSVVQDWYLNRLAAAEGGLKKAFASLFLLDVSPRLFAHLQVLRLPIVVGVIYVFTGSIPFCVLAAIGAWFAPHFIVQFMINRRMQRFDEQLVEALGLLASSARAGLSLAQALEAAAEKMPAPASQEFGLIVKEFHHGTSIERVLLNARERLARPNFSIVVTALIVNRDKGGNLIECLDKISSSLREISRLDKKIMTETASVRFSARLMALMPVTIGIIFYFIEPSSMELLFTDFVGNIILFFVVLLNVIAMAIIQRIVTVEI
jgi:tight adherence protein B